MLYRFGMSVNLLSLYFTTDIIFRIGGTVLKFFAAQAATAGFGEGTPQQVSREGQNRRIADFGTVVETCSKKVMLSAASANTTIPAGRFGFSGFQ